MNRIWILENTFCLSPYFDDFSFSDTSCWFSDYTVKDMGSIPDQPFDDRFFNDWLIYKRINNIIYDKYPLVQLSILVNKPVWSLKKHYRRKMCVNQHRYDNLLYIYPVTEIIGSTCLCVVSCSSSHNTMI